MSVVNLTFYVEFYDSELKYLSLSAHMLIITKADEATEYVEWGVT